MALVSPVLQVVGFQNSGKTTLVHSLIQYLEQEGVSTGILKHHGHGGKPDFVEEKDSAKHFNAGAIVSMVEGEGVTHLLAQVGENQFHTNLTLLQLFNPDLILIEGYKRKPLPKIVMVRQMADYGLLQELDNIRAAVCWPDLYAIAQKEKFDFPLFHIDDRSLYPWVKTQYHTFIHN